MNPILAARNVTKYFPVKQSFIEALLGRKRLFVRAVDGVSLEIEHYEVFALVGESGSGKTTFGKLCVGVYPQTSGSLLFEGHELGDLEDHEREEYRRSVQMIFQDPSASLNPRTRVGKAIEEPLAFNKQGDAVERREATLKIMEKVGLTPAEEFVSRYPHELSGGQRQRVVIARSLILEPKFLVADEPIAMLDVSVRAQILRLLLDFKRELNLTLLLITHDLATAKYFADRVAIMYLGEIVELGSRRNIFENPLHPYTKALLSAVPIPDPSRRRKRLLVPGEIPSAMNPPPACRFHPRCPYVFDRCRVETPRLVEIEKGHYVACHLYDKK